MRRWLIAAEIWRARFCGDNPTWSEAEDRVEACIGLGRAVIVLSALVLSILIVVPR